MKTRIFAIALIACAGLYISSCSPKVVAMQPSDPNVPQMPAPAKTVNAERVAQGKSIYEGSCAKCHKLFSPTDFSSAEWGPILMRMQPKAHLQDADMALVSDYINSLAKS
ncbi:MAG: cytochrome c [Flavobacterium sp.]|nr:MAG: cytochrome c [Flavobacterium sp.]